MNNHAVSVQKSPTDESLPAEIKEGIRDSNAESVVFRDKANYLNAGYTISYQKN